MSITARVHTDRDERGPRPWVAFISLQIQTQVAIHSAVDNDWLTRRRAQDPLADRTPPPQVNFPAVHAALTSPFTMSQPLTVLCDRCL